MGAGTYKPQSDAAREEIDALGLFSETRSTLHAGLSPVRERAPIARKAIVAPEILNNPTEYARPSSFSRGLRVDLPGFTLLLLSGTASVDQHGATLYPGDFEAQCWRTYRNLTHLLAAEHASWHDVARTSCYLCDIERDYDKFNEIRTAFMAAIGLDPPPASTGIQACLCRSDLLIEIEAIALLPNQRDHD